MWRMLYSDWGAKLLRKAPPPSRALPYQGSFLCVALARSGLPVAMRCVKVGSGRLVWGPSPPPPSCLAKVSWYLGALPHVGYNASTAVAAALGQSVLP